MAVIRILLAEDHHLVRAAFRSMLSSLPDVDVSGEASTGLEAVRLAAELSPDVVLMDVLLPELHGIEAARQIIAARPETRVIMLSMSANEDVVLQAMRSGASGYLHKDAEPAELHHALKAVARGEQYLSSSVSGRVVEACLEQKGSQPTPVDLLTPRQREVLQLLAEGKSTKQIASRLGVSTKAIEKHRIQIMETLNIHSVAGLVRFALRHGLISPDF